MASNVTVTAQAHPQEPKMSNMKVLASGEFYILTRNLEESQRLDGQHLYMISLCDGNLVHESIAKQNILSVADVATGTGIWIRDLKRGFDTTYPDGPKRYYHGYDISDQQLSRDFGDSGIHFSLQDCLKPFPSEHHGKYDLVHLRLLVAALKISDYEQAVANIATILKPGGYLQWEELDHSYFLADLKTLYQGHHSAADTVHLCVQGQLDAGASRDAPASIVQAAQSAGLVNIARYDFNTRNKPEIWPVANFWIGKAFETLSRIFLKKKRDNEGKDSASWRSDSQIEEEVERRMRELKDAQDKGIVVHTNMGMVVAQKT